MRLTRGLEVDLAAELYWMSGLAGGFFVIATFCACSITMSRSFLNAGLSAGFGFERIALKRVCNTTRSAPR